MRSIGITLSFLLLSLSVNASQWIGMQQEAHYEDLRTLVDYQLIDAVAVTFPVPWEGIGSQLQELDVTKLPGPARHAALRLKAAYAQYQHTPMQTRFYGATDASRFPGLDSQQGETARLSHQVDFDANGWSGRLRGNWSAGGETYLDGSFLAYSAGGWMIRAGAVDQFWGPAHGSSLILSTNARPVPTVGVFRNSAVRSRSRWLSWLGPWYASAELGQLESDRAVPDTQLWRTRFSAKPIKGLTLGFSWAAMWGGEGQPGSLSDFWDMLTFQTQCIDDLATCDPEWETTIGNHIAGFDLEYSLLAFGRPWSFYLQRVGEDAVNGYQVTDNATLFGVSTFDGPIRVYLEHSDTNVACNGDGNTATNCYYEHSTYTDGYRYHHRAIGSTFDSDAKQTTLGLRWQGSGEQLAAFSVSVVELNPDGQRRSPALLNADSEDLWYVQGYYQRPWRNVILKLGATAWDSNTPQGSQSDFTLYLDARYDW